MLSAIAVFSDHLDKLRGDDAWSAAASGVGLTCFLQRDGRCPRKQRLILLWPPDCVKCAKFGGPDCGASRRPRTLYKVPKGSHRLFKCVSLSKANSLVA